MYPSPPASFPTPDPANHPVPPLYISLTQTPRHSSHDAQATRDGGPLKVFALPRGVFGEGGNSDVEASKAGEAAEDEEREEEGVKWGAEAEGEGGGGRGDAEGDLYHILLEHDHPSLMAICCDERGAGWEGGGGVWLEGWAHDIRDQPGSRVPAP